MEECLELNIYVAQSHGKDVINSIQVNNLYLWKKERRDSITVSILLFLVRRKAVQEPEDNNLAQACGLVIVQQACIANNHTCLPIPCL
jgi:hypothetical protein